jgi:hypothetical protein
MIGPWPHGKAIKLKRAMRRYAKMNEQHSFTVDWILTQRVVMSGRLTCDLGAIKKALAADRAQRKTKKPDGTEEKRGRPALPRQRVAVEMLSDLKSGAMTVDSLRKAKGEFLAKRYGRARGTCVKARKIALIKGDVRKHRIIDN